MRENLWLAAARVQRGARARAVVDDMLERVGLDGDRVAASSASSPTASGNGSSSAWCSSTDPDLVLLDEPAAGMTDKEVARTAELVREINKTKALIVVEHDMQFIRMIASKVTVFNQGAILVEDDVEAIMRNPTRARRLSRQAGRGMMLEVSQLAAGYGRIPILSDVSFTVAEGEFVGVLGHNGMGKTTLLRTLMGYLPATAGRVTFAGEDVTRAEPYRRARAGMGYVPQGREIFPGLSVLDNLRMGAVARNGGEARRDRGGARGVPAPQAADRPAGRRALRRRAAIARLGALPRRRAEADPARRADRGHPALDHRRDRRDASEAARPGRSDDDPGRAEPRVHRGAVASAC